MDRERIIQEIVSAIATLEEWCGDNQTESVKRFLRWFSDDALHDIGTKHQQALGALLNSPSQG